jgi:uncharacterized protein (DUF433 family)
MIFEMQMAKKDGLMGARWRGDRIVIDLEICHGQQCIAGTRIMVTNILSQLAGGYSIEQILEGYPELTYEDVMAAIQGADSATALRVSG